MRVLLPRSHAPHGNAVLTASRSEWIDATTAAGVWLLPIGTRLGSQQRAIFRRLGAINAKIRFRRCGLHDVEFKQLHFCLFVSIYALINCGVSSPFRTIHAVVTIALPFGPATSTGTREPRRHPSIPLNAWRLGAISTNPPYNLGSTGSLSIASTPNTHSWIRRNGSLRTKRSNASMPSANSRLASERLRPSPRLRSRARCGPSV